MIVWMLYSALVALVVAASARAAESLARLVGYRVRGIWAGALALTIALSASAPLRGVRAGAGAAAASPVIARGGAAVRRAASPSANVYAASLAAAMSAGLILVLAGVGRRFRKARRDWPHLTMHGVDVRVAPHIGPIVVGVMRPEVVVPRWLLARDAEDQRLVVTHENEHVRARDPLLLSLAWCAVIAAPWNPAVWYMLSRLRLAIELDCDARVLRRGAVPQSYGSLLIDVAQHASTLRLSALALTDGSSHLHQRILAMKPNVPRFARLRGGFAAAFALVGLLAACQAELPTVARPQLSPPLSAPLSPNGKAALARSKTLLLIDGVRGDLSRLDSLDRTQIATVNIVKGLAAEALYGADARNGVILITTKGRAAK